MKNIIHKFIVDFLEKNVLERVLFIYSLISSIVGRFSFCIAFAVYIIGALLFYIPMSIFEFDVNPGLNNLTDTMWYYFELASTIGLGEIRPVTNLGRLFSALFFLIGFPSLVAMGTGVVAFVVKVIKLNAAGRLMTLKRNHIIIISSKAERARKILLQLRENEHKKNNTPIVVCTTDKIDIILGGVEYIHYSSIDYMTSLSNTGIQSAKTIIIDTENDSLAMEMYLYIREKKYKARAVLALVDLDKEETIKRIDKIAGKDDELLSECVSASTPHEAVMSTLYPGTAAYNKDLYTKGGIEIADIGVPNLKRMPTVKEFADYIRDKFESNLRFILRDGKQFRMPANDMRLQPGDKLVCVVKSKVEFLLLNWTELSPEEKS